MSNAGLLLNVWKSEASLGRTARQLLQLRLQGDGGVVSTENFGRQAVHQLLEVLVQNRSLGKEQMSVRPKRL